MFILGPIKPETGLSEPLHYRKQCTLPVEAAFLSLTGQVCPTPPLTSSVLRHEWDVMSGKR